MANDKEAKAASIEEEMKTAGEEAAAEAGEAEEKEAPAEGEAAAEEGGEKKEDADEKEIIEEEPQETEETRYMRLAADFQNYKRRVEKEKQDIYSYANEKIALDIIDVMDNFERAMAHSGESEDKGLVEGMQMIFKQLKGVLDKHAILEIEAEGSDFDPVYHNAVMAEENDEYEKGKVIQVFQKGYTLKGKVIRPSMVKVSQ